MKTKDIPGNQNNYFTKSFASKGLRMPFNAQLSAKQSKGVHHKYKTLLKNQLCEIIQMHPPDLPFV